jgi:PAS domain S-box-containing protein
MSSIHKDQYIRLVINMPMSAVMLDHGMNIIISNERWNGDLSSVEDIWKERIRKAFEGKNVSGIGWSIEPCFDEFQDVYAVMWFYDKYYNDRLKTDFSKTILDNIPNIVFTKEEKELSLTYINKAGQDLIGLDLENAIGKNDFDFFPDEVARELQAKDREVLNSDLPSIVLEDLESSSGKRVLQTQKFPFVDEHGKKMILGISQDVTELEEQRRVNQLQAKLASIGELAAGVGHEINNPLAIIKGHLGIAHKRINKNGADGIPDLIKSLDKVMKAVGRVETIVRGLRTLSHSHGDEVTEFSIFDSIQESFNMVEEIYLKDGYDVRFKFMDNIESLLIRGNIGKLQQIVMNLIANARDATKSLDMRLIEISLERKENSIFLKVADNGHGIPKEIQEKIFDPFFTTKDVNQGTGIGLSLVHGFVNEMDGELILNSVEGEGTTICLKFPIVSQHKAAA